MSRSSERIAERQIARWLFEEAAERGFGARVFACHPPTGDAEDAIRADGYGLQYALTVDQCLAHADAWDSRSVVEFRHGSGRTFWVLLAWGTGADVISDYGCGPGASAEVREICEAVYKRAEE